MSRFDKNQLEGIVMMMNDTFQVVAPELSNVDFIVELYECQKADFLYEEVDELINDILIFAEEEFD